MAATVQAQFASGAGAGSLVNAETGVKWNRDDTQTGTSATIPIPTSVGTNFSALKYLALVVTATSTTNITNRRIALASATSTGLNIWFFNQPTYTQNTLTTGTAAGNYPANDATVNTAHPGVAPTTTINNSGGYAAGTATMTVASGTSFTNNMVVVVGLGTANAEVLTVSSSTATSITFTGNSAKSHNNSDLIAQAYTLATTTNQVWDNSTVSTASATKNGNYVQVVLGVDNSYTGGAGSNVALPTLNLVYDEA